MYVAGFPCQPFSTAGLQRGFADTKDGRGELFWEVLRYIEDRRPKIFLLENVEGLTTLDGGKTLSVILEALKSVGSGKRKSGETQTKGIYDVHWKVLNTSDHGIPQNRRRWYCVGIRRGVMKVADAFSFPDPIRCTPIEKLLEKTTAEEVSKQSDFVSQNIDYAERHIKKEGGNPSQEHFIVDCDASRSRLHWRKGISPCLTRARHKGHWITNKKRRFTKEEVFRLQGMDPTKFKVTVSSTKLGQLVGNSMSVNVLERVLLRALASAGLAVNLVDRWANGQASLKLQAT